MKEIAKLLVIIAMAVGVLGFIWGKVAAPGMITKVINEAIVSQTNKADYSNSEKMVIDQDLSQNKGMFLQVAVNNGKVALYGNSVGDKLTGEIKYTGGKPTYEYKSGESELGLVTIKSTDNKNDDVNLHLSKETNARVDVGLGVGTAIIDLRGLDIPYLNVAAGTADVEVTFSGEKNTEANIAAGTGRIVLKFAKKSARKIVGISGVGLNMPANKNYEKIKGGYQTIGFDKAKVQTMVSLGQAVGGFDIVEY